MRKSIFYLMCLFAILFSTGCKYDLTCAGTYSGTYSTSLPGYSVTSGNATVVVTEVSNENYTAVISSSGNPDLTISNITGYPNYSLDGAVYYYSFPNGSFTVFEYGEDNNYNKIKWSLNIYFSNSMGTFDFNGKKI